MVGTARNRKVRKTELKIELEGERLCETGCRVIIYSILIMLGGRKKGGRVLLDVTSDDNGTIYEGIRWFGFSNVPCEKRVGACH